MTTAPTLNHLIIYNVENKRHLVSEEKFHIKERQEWWSSSRSPALLQILYQQEYRAVGLSGGPSNVPPGLFRPHDVTGDEGTDQR